MTRDASSVVPLWADDIAALGQYPDVRSRRLVLRSHVKVTEAIAAGNGDLAQRTARRHLDESQTSSNRSRDRGL